MSLAPLKSSRSNLIGIAFQKASVASVGKCKFKELFKAYNND